MQEGLFQNPSTTVSGQMGGKNIFPRQIYWGIRYYTTLTGEALQSGKRAGDWSPSSGFSRMYVTAQTVMVVGLCFGLAQRLSSAVTVAGKDTLFREVA